jgi:hypothetical protein
MTEFQYRYPKNTPAPWLELPPGAMIGITTTAQRSLGAEVVSRVNHPALGICLQVSVLPCSPEFVSSGNPAFLHFSYPYDLTPVGESMTSLAAAITPSRRVDTRAAYSAAFVRTISKSSGVANIR